MKAMFAEMNIFLVEIHRYRNRAIHDKVRSICRNFLLSSRKSCSI